MAFVQAAAAVASKPSEFANVGFTAIERVLQGIIIFICVILIIVFVSVGFSKSGIICGILGIGGLVGTAYWINSGGSFSQRAAQIKASEQIINYNQRQQYQQPIQRQQYQQPIQRQQYQQTRQYPQRRMVRKLGRGEEWKFEPVKDDANIPDMEEYTDKKFNKPMKGGDTSGLTEAMDTVDGGDDCGCGEQFSTD